MAKKRGGIAGFYDRNKGAIKTIAPIAAGFIPGIGPMLGAGIGAAMGGLDREGKSGIGLDVGGAIKGGISGYGGAKLGQAAKGGLAKMFTAQGSDPVTKPFGGDSFNPFKKAPGIDAAAKSPVGVLNTPTDFADISGIGSKYVTPMPAGMPSPMTTAMPKIASQVAEPIRNPLARAAGSIAEKAGSALNNKEGLAFAGNALQTGAGILGSQAQGAREDRNYEEQQRQLRARAEMMAMFAPQMSGNLGMSNFGAYKSPYVGG